jgi:hypothetical protein
MVTVRQVTHLSGIAVDNQPKRKWGLVSGRRASLLDWLIVLAILVIIALFAHNAMWQRYLDGREAAAQAQWERTWSRYPPDQRPKRWVPNRKFRLPFDRSPL